MTDARLRDLWRRGRAGDVEARAQHLRERLRAGELEATRLEVAARLGDPAARLALDAPPEPGPDPIASVEELPEAVARRVALACARAVVDRALVAIHALRGSTGPASGVAQALEGVIARPDDAEPASRGLACADGLVRLGWSLAEAGQDDAGLGAVRALAWAARSVGSAAPAHAASALREALDVARAADDAGCGEGEGSEAALRDAVLFALLAV